MATNYVALSIRATDQAKPDLTDLKARLEALKGEVATARANVDSAEADAKLTDLEAKLAAVDKKVANPKIDMAGAERALAQLTAVDAALHHTEDVSKESGGNAGRNFADGFVSYVKPPMSKAGLITGGVLSGLAALPALTAGLGAAAGIGLGAAFLLKSNAGVKAAGTSLMGTLKGVMTQATAPLIKPLEAAFAQLGQFAKSIGPELGKVFSAVAPMIGPLLKGLESLVSGVLPGFLALMRAAAPAVSALASLLGGLGKGLGSMFQAFAPAIKASAGVLKMLGGLLNGLMPVIGKLAASLAGSLAPVLASFGKAIVALTPGITLIGQILGKLAGAILTSLSGALTAVAGLLQGIAPSFGFLAKVLGQVFTAMENTGVFGVLEDALEKLAPPLATLINALVQSLVPVLPAVISGITQFSAVLSGGLASFIGAIATGVTAIVTKLPFLVPLILGVVAAVKAWRIAQALLDVVLTANPIGLLIAAIAIVIGIVVEVVKHWNTLEAVAKKVFGAIAAVAAVPFDWIKSHWPLLLAILTGPIGLAVLFVVKHFGQIKQGASDMVGDVVRFFEGLPRRILTAVGDLGSLLFNAGKRVIQGLINGVKSMIGDVGNAIGSVVGEIKNFLPFSPAKKGPLSGSGDPTNSGRSIPRMIARGITAGMPDVAGAASRMAAAVNPRGGYGAAGYGGAGAAQKLQVELTMRGEMLKFLQATVRQAGGDPAMFQKKVAYR